MTAYIASQIFASDFKNSLVPDENEYVVYVDCMDYGAAVSRIVLKAKKTLSSAEIKTEDFRLRAYTPSDSITGELLSKSYEKKIVSANLSDEYGNPAEENSPYVTITCYCHPDYELTSPFNSSLFSNSSHLYNYKIENASLKLNIKKLKGFVCPQASLFNINTKTYLETNLKDSSRKDAVNYNYAWYLPETKEKVPLIVWLHGITEGGKNPYLPLMGIKSTALASPAIQGCFNNGAAVLIPQCSGSWLETTTLDPLGNKIWAPVDIQSYTSKITDSIDSFLNMFSDKEKEESVPTANVSYYANTLKMLIDDFVKENPEIDPKRIYIGGCSAGGFITLNMVLQYKGYFAAAFPVCPAYPDSKLTDNDIKYLSQIPVYFTWSDNDTTLNPAKYARATVERIKEQRRDFSTFTAYEEVIDKTGLLKGEDDKPYQYSGHMSWIYVLNEKLPPETEKLFTCLAKQSLK